MTARTPANCRKSPCTLSRWLLVAAIVAAARPAVAAGVDGRLQLQVVDGETNQPLAARIELKNARGRPVKLRQADLLPWGGGYYFDGQVTLALPRGQYSFELETGPEYRTRSGHFEIVRRANDQKRIEMHRFADLAAEGWWAGDLHAHGLDLAITPLVQRAEQLRWTPAAHQTEDRTGGLDQPLVFGPDALQIVPTPVLPILPILLAEQRIDAVGLFANQGSSADQLPRTLPDFERFQGAHGVDRYADWLYFQILEAGIRLPPAASLSSRSQGRPTRWSLPRPGTSRTYVHCDAGFSQPAWWDGLHAGRVFVTNGPLLRAEVRGQLPGHVFRIGAHETAEFEIGLQLATRETIEYLEIIKDGTTEYSVRLAEWAEQNGRLPTVRFEASGWFLIRAVTIKTDRFQRALIGPYYVEQDGKPRIHVRAAEFFLEWVDAAIANLPAANSLHSQFSAARDFWQQRRQQATAE